MINVTLFGNGDGSASPTVSKMELDRFFQRMRSDTHRGYVQKYREIYEQLISPEQYTYINKVMKVCFQTEYNRNGHSHSFGKYNGLVVLEVGNLNYAGYIRQVKREASNLPQTRAAFTGMDGHSVVILALASLPGMKLPETEEKAYLFHAHAYHMAVKSYTPVLSHSITLRQPTLDMTVYMPLDEEPFINNSAIPFVMEQPVSEPVDTLTGTELGRRLLNLKPGPEAFCSIYRAFSSACKAAREMLGDIEIDPEHPEPIVAQTARICNEIGIPEEECVQRCHGMYPLADADEIRDTVNIAYRDKKAFATGSIVSKKQELYMRLEEFLHRRYEVRFNDMLGMTEYRTRQSLDFVFSELGGKDLNTICIEAVKEGITASTGDISTLVENNYCPVFNPIEDYLENLPEWDGGDHIGAMARMVPTDNPYWERLFHRWFLSMVAHWLNMDKQHGNNTAPILIGAQGYRKSTFCKRILPMELRKFYTDRIDFRNNVEAERYLGRFLIINIDEFDQLTEKQFGFVKHLFQKTEANYRRLFSSAIDSHRRYASFIATTNQNQPLRDPTGNRRYICVNVTDRIDTSSDINYRQLYAQAYSLLRSGERYWLDDEDEALINETNTRFEAQDPLEMLVRTTFVNAEEGDSDSWKSMTEILGILKTRPGFKKELENLALLGKILSQFAETRNKSHRKGCTYYNLKERG